MKYNICVIMAIIMELVGIGCKVLRVHLLHHGGIVMYHWMRLGELSTAAFGLMFIMLITMCVLRYTDR